MSNEVAAVLPELLGRALRARIYDRRGRIEPVGKRRDGAESSLLLDVTGGERIAALSVALLVRPDTRITYWMQWPDLWIEFADDHGHPLVTLGLLRPDWLRWEPHGDLQLASPDSIKNLLSSWGVPADD